MNTGLHELIERIQTDEAFQAEGCGHFKQIQQVSAEPTQVCEDCRKLGDAWIRLRICLTCGYVGCCDSSVNKHARRHYEQTGHPMVLSFEPRELWMYCFADDRIYIAPE